MAITVKPAGTHSHRYQNDPHDFKTAKPETAKNKAAEAKGYRAGSFFMELNGRQAPTKSVSNAVGAAKSNPENTKYE
jgi:hypothetical protein